MESGNVRRKRWMCGLLKVHSLILFKHTLRPRQNGRHLPDGIFKCISLNENVWISFEISLKFVRKGSINNIPALVQVMAWRRPGDKPLSGPMMVRLPTHICVTRPQWVTELSTFVKVHESHPYLAGVTTDKLRRHLSNIDMISNRWTVFWLFWKTGKKMKQRKLV